MHPGQMVLEAFSGMQSIVRLQFMFKWGLMMDFMEKVHLNAMLGQHLPKT